MMPNTPAVRTWQRLRIPVGDEAGAIGRRLRHFCLCNQSAAHTVSNIRGAERIIRWEDGGRQVDSGKTWC